MNIIDFVYICGLILNFMFILRIFVNCVKIFFMGSVNFEEKVFVNKEMYREFVFLEKIYIIMCMLFKIFLYDL